MVGDCVIGWFLVLFLLFVGLEMLFGVGLKVVEVFV